MRDQLFHPSNYGSYAARALRLLGLTPQWCRYGALLFLVSTALIVGRWLELPNSYRGFLLHLGILTFAVIAQAQIWAWLPFTSIWTRRARIALAGCFLFAMVALQVTNFVSFEFLHTGPSIGLVPAYISHLHHDIAWWRRLHLAVQKNGVIRS